MQNGNFQRKSLWRAWKREILEPVKHHSRINFAKLILAGPDNGSRRVVYLENVTLSYKSLQILVVFCGKRAVLTWHEIRSASSLISLRPSSSHVASLFTLSLILLPPPWVYWKGPSLICVFSSTKKQLWEVTVRAEQYTTQAFLCYYQAILYVAKLAYSWKLVIKR